MFTIENPCNEPEGCCNKWISSVDNNLRAIMKVMRFSNRRGKSHYNKESMVKKEKQVLMQYNIIPKDPRGRKEELDYQSLIPMCSLNFFDTQEAFSMYHDFFKNCSLFEPVFTDIGMCHAYNAMPVLDILKPSYYTESFKYAFEEDLRSNATTHMGVEDGDSITFYLYGNFHRKIAMLLDMSKFTMPKATKFFMSITNRLEYFGMKNARKVIRAGYEYTWKIQAMEIEPSEDLRDLDMESRQCRFANEIDNMDIFKVYTKT